MDLILEFLAVKLRGKFCYLSDLELSNATPFCLEVKQGLYQGPTLYTLARYIEQMNLNPCIDIIVLVRQMGKSLK